MELCTHFYYAGVFKTKGILKECAKFIKFGITGVINTAVDFAVFWLLSLLGVNQYLSQIISYSCGMLNSYILNRSWTFESKSGFFGKQLFRFIAANILMLLISLAVLGVGTAALSLPKLAAKLIATAFTMCGGFLLNRLWVFKEK